VASSPIRSRAIKLTQLGIEHLQTRKVRPYSKFVLLVDDDPADLFIFKRLLERADFQVIATPQAETAMTAIVSGEVGCLITEQMMPISGQELITYVRSVRSDIDVILLSGSEAPRETLPPDTIFIRKHERQKLVETVVGCMNRHKMA
jgi:CheY-like chemotaxis protein